jgi:hypothetical protein
MDQVVQRMTPLASAEDAVRVLNEALQNDPEAVQQVFGHVPHNGSLASHPTIQVAGGSPQPHLSALGLINGIFGVHSGKHHGFICVVLDVDTRRILRFELTRPDDGSDVQQS